MKKPLEIIESYAGRSLRIMEVCGTHTHEIFRCGIRKILPPGITLVSGPGCPVCVTPPGYIDSAVALALKHRALICTFGDLIRVPGSEMSLAEARGQGAEVRPVYTPLDAVELARRNPEREVVFLAVGFETTAPSSCIAVKHAERDGIGNFSLLTSNKTMPEAYKVLAGCADAFLYPGHVHTIIGSAVCRELLKSGVSGVIAGFRPEVVTSPIPGSHNFVFKPMPSGGDGDFAWKVAGDGTVFMGDPGAAVRDYLVKALGVTRDADGKPVFKLRKPLSFDALKGSGKVNR